MKLSIIIPVLNEEKTIQACLQDLHGNMASSSESDYEIIVVDGGSTDKTTELLANSKDDIGKNLRIPGRLPDQLPDQLSGQPSDDAMPRLVRSKAGRAVQMNAGANAAKGDVLLFLHVDTLLPEQAYTEIKARYLKQENRLFWGRFDMRLSGDAPVFRMIEAMMNLRSRMTSVATGDQAIFVSRALFAKAGGYADIPLMEDVAISKRLRTFTAPANLEARVTSSTRRWQNRGVFRTILLMWKLRLYYFLGVDPAQLAKMYR